MYVCIQVVYTEIFISSTHVKKAKEKGEDNLFARIIGWFYGVNKLDARWNITCMKEEKST